MLPVCDFYNRESKHQTVSVILLFLHSGLAGNVYFVEALNTEVGSTPLTHGGSELRGLRTVACLKSCEVLIETPLVFFLLCAWKTI